MGAGDIWMGHEKFSPEFVGLRKKSSPIYGATEDLCIKMLIMLQEGTLNYIHQSIYARCPRAFGNKNQFMMLKGIHSEN